MSRGIYLPSYPSPSIGTGIQPGFRTGGFGGGGGGEPFSFPAYYGFDEYADGTDPPDDGDLRAVDADWCAVQAIGYGATRVPDYPLATTYSQTKQWHRTEGSKSIGVQFDLGDLAINPSTATEKLRIELFGSHTGSSYARFYLRLTDTKWATGALQNAIEMYMTWQGGGNGHDLYVHTGGVIGDRKGFGGWTLSYGNPTNLPMTFQWEIDFAGDIQKIAFQGRLTGNVGQQFGAWKQQTYTDVRGLNASLRYLQVFSFGDGTGTREMQFIHAWCGTGSDAFPGGVKPE